MNLVNANATIYEELPQQLAGLVVDAEWSASRLRPAGVNPPNTPDVNPRSNE